MNEIDLNADVGEGCGDDRALVPLVTSANIACGGHAGDESTIRATIRLALENGVAVGAHPSYRDRENFGRVVLERTPAELYEEVRSQLETFARVAREERAIVHHVKAHGALYNVAARDGDVADAISRAVADVFPGTAVYALAAGRQIESARRFALRPVAEGFADRRYMPDGTLVPRSQPNALIDNEEEALRQAIALAKNDAAQTICLHGDGAHAIAFARRIRSAYEDAGIAVTAP